MSHAGKTLKEIFEQKLEYAVRNRDTHQRVSPWTTEEVAVAEASRLNEAWLKEAWDDYIECEPVFDDSADWEAYRMREPDESDAPFVVMTK